MKRATSLVNCSQSSAKRMEKEENETVNALASLSVHVVQQNGAQATNTTTTTGTADSPDEKRLVNFIFQSIKVGGEDLGYVGWE